MSRLFVGDREVNFFHGLAKELIQKTICQKIIYYSVSEKHTNAHRLYDEAIKKTVYHPVEVNALILFTEPTQSVGQFSLDTVYKVEVSFHIEELEERNLIPREGDFVKFGNVLYEIEKLTRPQIIYGQINNEMTVKASCRVARESQIDIDDGLSGV